MLCYLLLCLLLTHIFKHIIIIQFDVPFHLSSFQISIVPTNHTNMNGMTENHKQNSSKITKKKLTIFPLRLLLYAAVFTYRLLYRIFLCLLSSYPSYIEFYRYFNKIISYTKLAPL